jgi:hypothetical protein
MQASVSMETACTRGVSGMVIEESHPPISVIVAAMQASVMQLCQIRSVTVSRLHSGNRSEVSVVQPERFIGDLYVCSGPMNSVTCRRTYTYGCAKEGDVLIPSIKNERSEEPTVISATPGGGGYSVCACTNYRTMRNVSCDTGNRSIRLAEA